jgi:uncharacterized membrane protein (DUF4010 family)
MQEPDDLLVLPWRWVLIACLAVLIVGLPSDWRPLPWGMPLQKALIVCLIILLVQQTGMLAVRWLGVQHGFALTGLASGFVSSTATIAGMGSLARQEKALAQPLAVGALLSCVATMLQALLILSVLQSDLAKKMAMPLIASALVFVIGALLQHKASVPDLSANQLRQISANSETRHAFYFMALIYGTSVIAQWSWQFGDMAITSVIMLSALADVHAAILATVDLGSTHWGMPASTVWVMLMAISINAVLKAWIATIAGGEASFSTTMQRYIAISCIVLWITALVTGVLTT